MQSSSVWPSSSAIPLCDRDRELSVLLERARRALVGGSAQVVNIVADRGMGKSVLVNALLDRLGDGALPECRVLRAGAPIPGQCEPLEQLLLARFHSPEDCDDGPARRRLRHILAERCRELGVGEIPFVTARLLRRSGVQTPLLQAVTADSAPLEGPASTILSGIWNANAKWCPLVLVVEDLHFCSQSTIDWVRSLHRTLTGHVLVVVTSRVDEFRDLGAAANVCTLGLSPLTAERCAQLVKQQLCLKESEPPALLVDTCLSLSRSPAGVTEALQAFEAHGAVIRTAIPAKPLALDDNRLFYVADLLLAEHAEQGSDSDAAVSSYRSAANIALRAHQPSWCVTLLERALALQSDSSPVRAEMLLLLGQAQSELGHDEVALASFQSMALVARECDASRLLALAHSELGKRQLGQGELLLAHHHLEVALQLFEYVADADGAGAAHNEMARVALLTGDLLAAREHLKLASVAAARSGNNSRVAAVLTTLACLAIERGQNKQALSALREALNICRERADVVGVLANLHILGRLAQTEGAHSRALELLLDALDLLRDVDHYAERPLLLIEIAESYQQLGHFAEAARSLSRAERLLGQNPNKLVLAQLRMVEARTHLGREDLPRALLAAQSAVSLCRQGLNRARLAAALRTLGDVLAASELCDGALVSRCFMDSVGLGRLARSDREVAHTYRSFARYALSAPELSGNHDICREAYQLASLAEDLLSRNRLEIDPSAWFELRLAGLAMSAPSVHTSVSLVEA